MWHIFFINNYCFISMWTFKYLFICRAYHLNNNIEVYAFMCVMNNQRENIWGKLRYTLHTYVYIFLSPFSFIFFLSGVKALRPGDKFILIIVDTSSEMYMRISLWINKLLLILLYYTNIYKEYIMGFSKHTYSHWHQIWTLWNTFTLSKKLIS